MRHRAHLSVFHRLLSRHRPRTVLATVALLAVGLVTGSVVTASGPPDGTDRAIEAPSYPGASYDPPTPTVTGSSGPDRSERPSEEVTASPSPSMRPTQSPVSRSAERGTSEPTPEVTPSPEAPAATSGPTDAPTSEPPAADAPQTTATTRSANASRWVIGVASDTDATYQCSLDGGAYQSCDSTVTYDGLEKGTHTFAARATDADGDTDPSPATLTAEIGPRGQD